MRILIDSDAYIGIYSKSDAHHSLSIKILDKLDKNDVEYFTSWDVVDETTTKLSYFLSKDTAKNFLSDLTKSTTIVIYPDSDLLDETSSRFSSINSKRVSFTDCFNIVAYNKFEIDYIFSFDKIYKQQKLKMLS